jgi:hypothetical protein
VDADRFDTIARTLHSTPTRRLTLGALTALGLAAILGDHEVAAKKKGGGKKDGGKKKKKKGVKCQGKSCKKEEEKQFCHPAGEQCTFTPYPCCAGTVCCETALPPYNIGTCLPPAQCCTGEICSAEDGSDCPPGCTCQLRDDNGFGKCLA